jgi:hypothetical protein
MEFRQWLEAAEDEQYAFKAVFTAGGPGSGKTRISQLMFPNFLHANSDQIQVLRAKAMNVSPTPPPNAIDNPEYGLFMQRMKQAQRLNEKRANNWARQGYPVVIDTTGRDFGKIRTINDQLRSIGYDTSLVFVNTKLETAHSRNQLRQQQGQHGAENDYLIQAWHDAQSNIEAYRDWFGDDRFALVDNDADERGLNPRSRSEFLRILSSAALRILGRPFTKEEIQQKIERNRNV